MTMKVMVKQNVYHDSVTLMLISQEIKKLKGVREALIAMGTDLNKDLAKRIGIEIDINAATPNDLFYAIDAENDDVIIEAVGIAEKIMSRGCGGSVNADVQSPDSISEALQVMPGANLTIISLPGKFAGREARKALGNNLHVMLFSDNVSIKEEKQLKELAHQKGLLLMGPDCGTAIINGVPLCFANKVNRGNIGIVTASGTGGQEVSSLIDRLGGGISQLIGTGGRDLREEVGGIMVLDGLAALQADPQTTVIVLISKPPSVVMAGKVLNAVKTSEKPVVICFLGYNQNGYDQLAVMGYNLEDTARKAVMLAQGHDFAKGSDYSGVPEETEPAEIEKERQLKAAGQKYIRALYTGGSLCDEAIFELQKSFTDIYSNISKTDLYRLDDVSVSRGHTALDLGDDKFTMGRPHPMIDPTIRLSRLLQEAEDPETAVILLDVVLGAGSHQDPAGVLAPVVQDCKQRADQQGRHISFVASLCGTEKDMQDYHEQQRKLENAGVIVAKSNIRAARTAAAIVKGL